MSSTTAHSPSYRRSSRSVQLSFRFQGGQISLFDRRGVDQEPLPSTELAPRTAAEWTGCWIEVHDVSGHPCYRRPMPHPLLRRSEGREGSGTVRTVIWAPEQGAFVVTVPDVPGGELVMFASPTDRPEMPQAAAEILRVPLRAPRGDRRAHREDES